MDTKEEIERRAAETLRRMIATPPQPEADAPAAEGPFGDTEQRRRVDLVEFRGCSTLTARLD